MFNRFLPTFKVQEDPQTKQSKPNEYTTTAGLLKNSQLSFRPFQNPILNTQASKSYLKAANKNKILAQHHSPY